MSEEISKISKQLYAQRFECDIMGLLRIMHLNWHDERMVRMVAFTHMAAPNRQPAMNPVCGPFSVFGLPRVCA